MQGRSKHTELKEQICPQQPDETVIGMSTKTDVTFLPEIEKEKVEFPHPKNSSI